MNRCRAFVVVAVVACSSLLAACQRATDLGARNLCGDDIEVVLGSIVEETWRQQVVLSPGDVADVRSAPEDPERVYAFVRRVGDSRIPEAVLVDAVSIDTTYDSDGIDWLVPIDGPLCPA